MAESVLAATIRRAYAAFNEGDIDAILPLLAEDFELRPPASSLEPQPRYGADAVREYLTPDLFEEQTAEPVEFIEHGDRMLAVVRMRARGHESGVELDETVFHLITLEGERAVRFEVYLDREEAETALRA